MAKKPTAAARRSAKKQLPAASDKKQLPATTGGAVGEVKASDKFLPVVEPLWSEVLTAERIEEIRGMFADGMSSSEVAGYIGVPTLTFESWIRAGRVSELIFSVIAAVKSNDITDEGARTLLADNGLQPWRLERPPAPCARFKLAQAAARGSAELAKTINERILAEGSPSDLLKLKAMLNR